MCCPTLRSDAEKAMSVLSKIAAFLDRRTGSRSTMMAANHYLAGIGRILELRIDPRMRSIRLLVDLVGEEQPVELHIPEYSVICREGSRLITAGRFQCSRPWLEAVLNRYVAGREWTIPDNMADLVEDILG